MAAETDKPRVSLHDKDVATRAAAARDLSRTGTAEDVLPLLEAAKAEKSPSIRLCAAAAAADVALRHAADLDDVTRAAVVKAVTSVDPGSNPSLLMVLAAVPSPDVVRRLGRILRDPRYDVRAGAATALRRLAISGARADADALAGLEKEVRGWLRGGKHPPDVMIELVRIAGEAGLTALRDVIVDLGSRPELAEVVDEAVERFDARGDTSRWGGFWVSWGVDVLQPEPDHLVDWIALDGTVGTKPGGSQCTLRLADTPSLSDEPVRLVWAARPGVDPLLPAFQADGVAYWRVACKSLVSACSEVLPAIEEVGQAASVVAAELASVEGVSAKRLRGRLLWRAGTVDEALPLLTELTEGAKPRGEDLWVLAHVHDELGHTDAARIAVAKAIALAPQACSWRDDAESLAARLSA